MFFNFPWPSYIDLKARGEIWGGGVSISTGSQNPFILDETGFNLGEMLNVDTGGSGKKLKIIYGGIYRCSISSSVEISEMSSGFYIQRLNVNGASNDKLSFAAPVAGSLGCGADTKFIQFSPDDIVTCEIQTPEGTIVNFINYGLTVEKVGSDNEIGN